MMKELSEERDQLIIQSSELKKEAMLLQRANEEARQTQSLALEERSKVREEVQEQVMQEVMVKLICSQAACWSEFG